MKKAKFNLTACILISLVLGVIVGWMFPKFAVMLKPFSDMFLRMIKMIIAPLLFSTLVVGIAGHGNFKGLGKIGLKTIIYFEIVTTLALIIGLVVANNFAPGTGVHIAPTHQQLMEVAKLKSTQEAVSGHELLTHMVPTSVVDAMARGDMLQIVVFSLFFALALGAIGAKGQPILDGLKSLSEVMFKFTQYVMYFAPLGVFSAISSTIGANGIKVLLPYAKLMASLYFALIVFVCIVLAIACKLVQIPFMNMLRAIREPALLAFSTASSEAALPKAMDVMERFGVPKNIVSFVMPTGYTFNLDGSTLYLSLATIFIAQISNIHLTLPQQIMIMLTLMLTSKGMAAIPRVSLVVLTATLDSFHLPTAGVALLLGIDQILDMGRTTVNLIGNCVATAVIARWENAFDYCQMNQFMKKECPLCTKTEIPYKPPTRDIFALKNMLEQKLKAQEETTNEINNQ